MAGWGAHAPSRAGDDAIVIANFETGDPGMSLSVIAEGGCGEGAATSTRGACAPQKGCPRCI